MNIDIKSIKTTDMKSYFSPIQNKVHELFETNIGQLNKPESQEKDIDFSAIFDMFDLRRINISNRPKQKIILFSLFLIKKYKI
jgi:hypothetical protein